MENWSKTELYSFLNGSIITKTKGEFKIDYWQRLYKNLFSETGNSHIVCTLPSSL